MIRIAATLLEQYRRMMQTDYSPEKELVAAVRGEPREESWQARAGKAWHHLLETSYCMVERYGTDYRLKEQDFRFDPDAVLAARNFVGPGVWECKHTRVLNVWGLPVTLVAQADHVQGLAIQDNKAKFSQPDAGDYEQSLQWRAYLWVHQACVFRYNLFSFSDPKGEECHCELREIHAFKFWPYAALEEDLKYAVKGLLDWAAERCLTKYLHRQGTSPEAP